MWPKSLCVVFPLISVIEWTSLVATLNSADLANALYHPLRVNLRYLREKPRHLRKSTTFSPTKKSLPLCSNRLYIDILILLVELLFFSFPLSNIFRVDIYILLITGFVRKCNSAVRRFNRFIVMTVGSVGA